MGSCQTSQRVQSRAESAKVSLAHNRPGDSQRQAKREPHHKPLRACTSVTQQARTAETIEIKYKCGSRSCRYSTRIGAAKDRELERPERTKIVDTVFRGYCLAAINYKPANQGTAENWKPSSAPRRCRTFRPHGGC